MRLMIVPLVFGCIAPLIAAHDSFARSPYDYPWCAIYSKTIGATSCYYTSFQQCMATMSGIGGTCVRNPFDSAEHRWKPQSLRR